MLGRQQDAQVQPQAQEVPPQAVNPRVKYSANIQTGERILNSHTSASIAVIEAAGVASIGAALAALTEATVHGGVVNYSIVGVVALATFLGKLLPSNITEQVAADIAVGLPVLKAAETPAAQQTQTTSSTTTTSAPTPTVFPAA